MNKIFISLPITGNDYNDQRNHAYNVSVGLAQKGCMPVSPFEVIPSLAMSRNEALCARIAALLECDTIYLCKGWDKSPECRSEMQIALNFGMEVMTE